MLDFSYDALFGEDGKSEKTFICVRVLNTIIMRSHVCQHFYQHTRRTSVCRFSRLQYLTTYTWNWVEHFHNILTSVELDQYKHHWSGNLGMYKFMHNMSTRYKHPANCILFFCVLQKNFDEISNQMDQLMVYGIVSLRREWSRVWFWRRDLSWNRHCYPFRKLFMVTRWNSKFYSIDLMRPWFWNPHSSVAVTRLKL